VIVCCGKKQKVSTYIIEPLNNEIAATIEILNPCSLCDQLVIVIRSLMPDGSSKVVKRKGNDAMRIYNNITESGRIICQLKNNMSYDKGGWFLYYYDKGKKLKCYSNLATLRLGLTEPFQGLPQADNKKVIHGSFV